MAIDLQSLANDPVVTLGGFLFGIVGIVLAVIFYARAKKDRVPCFEVVSNTLIEGLHEAIDGLELRYKGVSQQRITVTKLAFWNAGRETIDKRDFVGTDPIGVTCTSSLEILDLQVIQVSAKSNSVTFGCGVTTKDDLHFYPIEFEYLDNEDFFVVQIVHSGQKDAVFNFQGKIKGVKKIEKATGVRVDRRSDKLVFLASHLDKMLFNKLFMKYAVSLGYLGLGAFGIWNLLQGRVDWYVWALTVFCFFGACVMYFGNRHIAPVKI